MAIDPLILVVDDEPEILEMLRARLRTAGYRVETARDGQEAIARIDKGRPALLILDIMLPDLNGFQVCRHVRKAHDSRTLPIVMLSAKGEPADRYWAEQVGADAFVDKPFDMRELLADIAQLLEARR